jgi:hypothetical protein
MTGFDAQRVATGAYGADEAAPSLDGSYPVTALGVLTASLTREVSLAGMKAQWLAEVPQDDLLLIQADELTDCDPVLSVVEESGRLLGMNDDTNDTLNSKLIIREPTGRN